MITNSSVENREKSVQNFRAFIILKVMQFLLQLERLLKAMQFFICPVLMTDIWSCSQWQKVYFSKFDRDHFLSIKICIVNVEIHGRVCTPYIAYCIEQQLVCIAILTKVYTLHIL